MSEQRQLEESSHDKCRNALWGMQISQGKYVKYLGISNERKGKEKYLNKNLPIFITQKLIQNLTKFRKFKDFLAL